MKFVRRKGFVKRKDRYSYYFGSRDIISRKNRNFHEKREYREEEYRKLISIIMEIIISIIKIIKEVWSFY